MQRKLTERQPKSNFTGPPQFLHFKSLSFILCKYCIRFAVFFKQKQFRSLSLVR